MAYATTSFSSTKKRINYARLCRLLVDVGLQVLRETFDRVRPPGSLHTVLADRVIHAKLKSLRKQKVLNALQWDKLYPAIKSSVSSMNFDITLLVLLLGNICGLSPPATGWDKPPPVTDATPEADIARIRFFRNTVYGHATVASVDDATFSIYWSDIKDTLLRLGGARYQDVIDDLENESDLNKLRKQWVNDEDKMKSRPFDLERKIVTLEMGDDVDAVPAEILVRGPLVLHTYNNALKEGKINVRRFPIMFIGQERSGKTSLKKSLKGDRFDANEESTRGIQVDPSHCKVTTEIWRPGKPDQTISSDSAISFDHHAARLIVRDLKGKQETSKASIGESSEAPSSASDEATDNSQAEIDRSFPNHGTSTIHDTQIASEVKCDQEQRKSTIEREIPDDLANLIEKLIREDVEVDKEDEIYSVLWDFGGQLVYYVTHPLFLTARAIYLLVYDLSRNLYEKAIPVRKQGLFKELEDSFSSKTNLDYLDSWMLSVASLVRHDEIQTRNPSEKLPAKLPPVFLVCTHADKNYCGGDSAVLAAEIYGSLQEKSYSSHLFDGVFTVDNTKSGSKHECPEVVRLRNEILSVAKELPQMNEEIPLKWLKFEKVLHKMTEDGYRWISLVEARKVATEVCNISDEEEFMTLVKLLHDQRIIIHFDDTPSLNKMVVLDIQWLIDVFKKVITIEPYDGKGKPYKDLWLKLGKTGILAIDEQLLQHVWGSLYDQKETSESLIEIMEKFSLLCSWPSSDERKQYLVPSMLMSHPAEDIIRLVKSSQVPLLYLTFNSCQVPIGLFPRMVLQFYQWCSKEWPSLCKPQFHQNFARFHICPDEGCSVILLCHSSFIEIVVHRENDEVCNLSNRLQTIAKKYSPNLVDLNPDVIVAGAVRRQVGLMLNCMPKEFVWLKNMECKMKVLCLVCCPGGAVQYCQDHGIKDCKQEECLHFWSEAELQSSQQFCDRSAVAGDPRLNRKHFTPWFAFLDEQQAFDGCAARELPSAEEKEAKALVVSTGVLESLRSPCEASNVVARLQQSLELNHEALADPGPETKRVIRSLAVIAKSENRLDVVKHLRQITPAGTTAFPWRPLMVSGKQI